MIILKAVKHFFLEALPLGKREFGDRLARLPWTKEEVKAHLKKRYLADEKRTLDLLASEGSGACVVHRELGLTRAIIKRTLKSLDHSRRLQMVFANISCGTFFKY